MESLVIWLLWTYMGTNFQEVDSFKTQSECERALYEQRTMVDSIIKETGNLTLKQLRFVGCQSVTVVPMP